MRFRHILTMVWDGVRFLELWRWRRTRNGCVATRGTRKNIAIRNSSHSEWLAIQTGSLGGATLR